MGMKRKDKNASIDQPAAVGLSEGGTSYWAADAILCALSYRTVETYMTVPELTRTLHPLRYPLLGVPVVTPGLSPIGRAVR